MKDAGSASDDGVKILVAQLGARHRYLVPQLLFQLGCLSAVYTDSYQGSSLGRLATLLAIPGASARRLRQRVISGIPKRYIRSTDAVFINRQLDALRGRRRSEIDQLMTDSSVLSRKMIQWGLPAGTSHVYTMFSENVTFVEWAASKGMKCLIDVYTTPKRDEIVNREFERLGLQHLRIRQEDTKNEFDTLKRIVQASFALVCPSNVVAQGVQSLFPEAKAKIRIVPYASTLLHPGKSPRPVPGRILFVGQDPVRKGLYRLAEAIRGASTGQVPLELRVVGEISRVYTEDSRLSNCIFLGKLNREQLTNEFLAADIFVMPSLAEGSVAAVSESIVLGCPVIITKECGVDSVEHGKQGMIVSSHSTDEIKDAIVKCVSDRSFRDRLAMGCRDASATPTLAQWRDKIISVGLTN